MKIFCDTNIIAEYLEDRQYSDLVERILERYDDEFYMSVSSLYTLSYIVDRYYRSRGVLNPERTQLLKQELLDVLDMFNVSIIGKRHCKTVLESPDFTDIEDGFQYQAALACEADVLLTINIKDFQDADQSNIKILTPSMFMEQYPSA